MPEPGKPVGDATPWSLTARCPLPVNRGKGLKWMVVVVVVVVVAVVVVVVVVV